MRLPRIGWLATSWLMLSAGVQAQELVPSAALGVGARVRITAPELVHGQIRGAVLGSDDRSLTIGLDGGASLRVARPAITGLDVSTGRHRQTLKGMIIGLGVAAGLGALLPPAAGQTKADVVGRALLGGAAWGAGIGALIKRDAWSPVPLDRVRVSLTPTRGRGVTLSLSLGI